MIMVLVFFGSWVRWVCRWLVLCVVDVCFFMFVMLIW